MASLGVSDVLNRFLPRFLSGNPALNEDQWRAVRAIQACRTPALGAEGYTCRQCGRVHWACHSCNHKACPRCGRDATARWVQRELGKLVNAPYFMVTFTLPAQLRGLFLGPDAKEAFDLFFAASSKALSEKLAFPKWLGATTNGFTGVLHTWNQQLLPHIHIHYIVPGAGLDAQGQFVRVKSDSFLVHESPLQGAFRAYFREQLQLLGWGVDPKVWQLDWGVKVQPFGTGENAVKYLGTYVSRSAIADSRILAMTQDSVTFTWKDRRHGGCKKSLTLPGSEFVQRYLRHVHPRGMRAVRYFGFCHPAAKNKRLRIQFQSGRPLVIHSDVIAAALTQEEDTYKCKICGGIMDHTLSLDRTGQIFFYTTRGPPQQNPPREEATL
jgi:hypothetical protein